MTSLAVKVSQSVRSPFGIVFVDESGDPGLSEKAKSLRPYFVIGFVYCDEPFSLRKHLRRHLKRMHLSRKYPPHLAELKFYLPHTDLIQKGYTIQRLKRYESFIHAIRMKAIDISTSIFVHDQEKERFAIDVFIVKLVLVPYWLHGGNSR